MSDLLQRLESLWMNTESHTAASTSLIARDALERINYLERVLFATQSAIAQTPPQWWPAVENILNEYGLQAIDFVADFKKAKEDK